ncbi:MAG TPA: hypothetical protein VEH04_14680 [Verrucomicrobiae bacterium]|nr:hypothetical protein [Verrucomicrobiae bacterium]
MRIYAHEILEPVFHFLDWLISEYGLYLFLGFTVLCLVTIAWVLSGGLRPKDSDGSDDCDVSVGIIIYPPKPPPDPPEEWGPYFNPPQDCRDYDDFD